MLLSIGVAGSWQLWADPLSADNPDDLHSPAQQDALSWEDATVAPLNLPEVDYKTNFNRFLAENINHQISQSTLEWLNLPLKETAYESWYLGVINSFHIFSFQTQEDSNTTLMIFDHDGKIRDRNFLSFGKYGGGFDVINLGILAFTRYDQNELINGIQTTYLSVDHNGQFKALSAAEFVHPKRKYPETSVSILLNEDLKKMSIDHLTKMRNELFASKGHRFKDENFQKYFEAKEWYVVANGSIDSSFSDIERYNAQQINALID